MKRTGNQMRHFMMRFCGIHADELHSGCLSAAMMTALFVMICSLSGAPYRVYWLFRNAIGLLPLGLYTILNLFFTIAIGFAFGLVFSHHGCRGRIREEKYRAGMFFILLAVCWLAVYPLLFRGMLFFGALISLCAAWLLSLWCIRMFYRIQALSGILLGGFLLWISYLIITLAKCIFL